MNRILLLVSDKTGEFPDNTTSSFKVSLGQTLELKGEGGRCVWGPSRPPTPR